MGKVFASRELQSRKYRSLACRAQFRRYTRGGLDTFQSMGCVPQDRTGNHFDGHYLRTQAYCIQLERYHQGKMSATVTVLSLKYWCRACLTGSTIREFRALSFLGLRGARCATPSNKPPCCFVHGWLAHQVGRLPNNDVGQPPPSNYKLERRSQSHQTSRWAPIRQSFQELNILRGVFDANILHIFVSPELQVRGNCET